MHCWNVGLGGGSTLETPSAVMRTTLSSNLERRSELCSALSATVCKFCCRYFSAYASPRRMPSAAGVDGWRVSWLTREGTRTHRVWRGLERTAP